MPRSDYNVKLSDNITHLITMHMYGKTVEFKDLNYKLNANKYLIILPVFDIYNENSDGFYKNGSQNWVMLVSQAYVLFTVSGTYKISFQKEKDMTYV